MNNLEAIQVREASWEKKYWDKREKEAKRKAELEAWATKLRSRIQTKEEKRKEVQRRQKNQGKVIDVPAKTKIVSVIKKDEPIDRPQKVNPLVLTPESMTNTDSEAEFELFAVQYDALVAENLAIKALEHAFDPKPPKRPPALVRQEEKKTADLLASQVDGKREVSTDDGFIDILTKDYVIEVKIAENYKHAIGQALVYGFHYPSKQPMIYLFGAGLRNYKEKAQRHCKRLGILYRDSTTGV